MTLKNLAEDFNYLFKCDFFSNDFDPENQEEHLDFAEMFLRQYSWEDIYSLYFNYLTKECLTAETVYNVSNLFYYYGFIDKPIDEPYKLAGYILFRINLEDENAWELYGNFIDSFIVHILKTCNKLDLRKDPYYQPWKDAEILNSIDEWRSIDNK